MWAYCAQCGIVVGMYLHMVFTCSHTVSANTVMGSVTRLARLQYVEVRTPLTP